MVIDEATVRQIARLARIGVTDEEVHKLQRELDGILDWVKELSAIDTEGVPPMTGVGNSQLRMRPDVVTEGDQAGLIVRNAPLTEDNFFLVPKVIE